MTSREHLTIGDLVEGDTFHAFGGLSSRTVLGTPRRLLNFVDLDLAMPGTTDRVGTWHLHHAEEVEVEPREQSPFSVVTRQPDGTTTFSAFCDRDRAVAYAEQHDEHVVRYDIPGY